MYYANAPTYHERVQSMIEQREAPPRALIIDASSWYQIDLTSTEVLKKMVGELRGENIDVFIADVHVPVLEYGRKTGLFELLGEDHVFHTLDEAVNCIEDDQGLKSHPQPSLTK